MEAIVIIVIVLAVIGGFVSFVSKRTGEFDENVRNKADQIFSSMVMKHSLIELSEIGIKMSARVTHHDIRDHRLKISKKTDGGYLQLLECLRCKRLLGVARITEMGQEEQLDVHEAGTHCIDVAATGTFSERVEFSPSIDSAKFVTVKLTLHSVCLEIDERLK